MPNVIIKVVTLGLSEDKAIPKPLIKHPNKQVILQPNFLIIRPAIGAVKNSTAFIIDPPLEITARLELKLFNKGINKMP